MSNLTTFEGKGDVQQWASNMRAKLISKGYKSQLLDANRPQGQDAAVVAERKAWERDADKALGIILTYLHSDITTQFEDKLTPQTLLDAVKAYFTRDVNQEIIRLESELINITYNGSDPIKWASGIRNIISKLTAKGAPPVEKTIVATILRALEKEPEYSVRVQMIKFNTPNITLVDLWAAIGKFPYPLERERGEGIGSHEIN